MSEPEHEEGGPEHKVVEYRSPRARDEYTEYIGMMIFLSSWAMLFCGLFMAYALIRSRASVWPPADQPALPLGVPFFNTLILGCSSATMHAALRAIRSGRQNRTVKLLGLTTALGFIFLGLQAAVWISLAGAGLTLASGPYASIVYGLTGFHGLHVVFGLGALLWMTWRAWRGLINPARHQAVKLWAMYWHFVGAVWLLMFLGVYVL